MCIVNTWLKQPLMGKSIIMFKTYTVLLCQWTISGRTFKHQPDSVTQLTQQGEC